MTEPLDETGHGESLTTATKRKLSFFQTVRAVFWAFFGVRKSADYARDVGQLNPVHLIIAALLAAIGFVTLLVVLANWVISSGVAA